MGMRVLSYLRQTLRKKDKSKDVPPARRAGDGDGDWDFGARQMPDTSTDLPPPQRRRSSSLDSPRHPPMPLADPTLRSSREPHSSETLAPTEKRVSATSVLDIGRVFPVMGNDAKVDEMKSFEPASSLPQEDSVLVAAGENAKVYRGLVNNGEKCIERRRRVQSVAAIRLSDIPSRPQLRHASSAYMTRELPPTPPLKDRDSPAPSMASLRHSQAGPSSSRSSVQQNSVSTKRSLPQLHNIWEDFLVEASENTESSGSSHPSHQCSRTSQRATVHKASDLARPFPQGPWRPNFSHPPLPRRVHSPSSSSVLSCSSAPLIQNPSSPKALDLTQPPTSPPRSLNQRDRRVRGHVRTSHQTSSSTSTFSGSTSSMASSLNMSSASSMTTVCDDNEPDTKHENFRGGDDPSICTPSAESNSRSEYFPLRLPTQRDRSPASLYSHYSQTTPYSTAPSSRAHTPVATSTPTSASLPLTPSSSRSPSRSSPLPVFKHNGRFSPRAMTGGHVGAAAATQWRRSRLINPEDLIYEPPLTPGSSKSNSFPRVSLSRRVVQGSDSSESSGTSTGCAEAEAEAEAEADEDGDDVLSDLEYYYSSHTRPRPSMPEFTPPQSAATSPRRSSMAMSLPRCKSASNINHAKRAQQRGPSSPRAEPVSPDVDEHGRKIFPHHPNQLHLFLDPLPPSPMRASVISRPPRSTSLSAKNDAAIHPDFSVFLHELRFGATFAGGCPYAVAEFESPRICSPF
ncbi:hypothetical protein DFH11DRAFT_1540729 [Phellopilus nigrolimitatus]|nr:hypothetical protein DFH11DRAFT_1540729 [Phellopilus nigrolimitatus]